jgi:hypothetical protein
MQQASCVLPTCQNTVHIIDFPHLTHQQWRLETSWNRSRRPEIWHAGARLEPDMVINPRWQDDPPPSHHII